jgi:hypothetical protein
VGDILREIKRLNSIIIVVVVVVWDLSEMFLQIVQLLLVLCMDTM